MRARTLVDRVCDHLGDEGDAGVSLTAWRLCRVMTPASSAIGASFPLSLNKLDEARRRDKPAGSPQRLAPREKLLAGGAVGAGGQRRAVVGDPGLDVAQHGRCLEV